MVRCAVIIVERQNPSSFPAAIVPLGWAAVNGGTAGRLAFPPPHLEQPQRAFKAGHLPTGAAMGSPELELMLESGEG